MIGSVDHVMAGAAVLAEQLLGGSTKVRDIRSGIQAAGMISLVMTLLTQVRSPNLQQAFLGGTMGIVTDGTVFPYGGVLPQERAALLRMALVTCLVDGVLHQLRRAGRAMGVMTVGADYLAFADRMAGTPETLGALVLVALETDIGLSSFCQNRIVQTNRVMAVCTGITGRGMGADVPVHPDITRRAIQGPAFMALQAHSRTLFGIEIFHGDHDGWLLAWFLHVFAHGAVTGFATPVGQGASVFAVGEGLHELLMAFQAFAAVIGLGRSPNLRIQGGPVHSLGCLSHA